MATTSTPVVVFDLDDTLYLERDYVRSGFRAVAEDIGTMLPALRQRCFDILWEGFTSGVRGDSFDRLASLLPEVAAHVPVDRMIGIYRRHRPDIAALPGAHQVLNALRSRHIRCGLITDGRPDQQHAKLEALGLRAFFDRVIVNEGPDRFKPDSRSFRQMERDLEAGGPRCWYVADNPRKDFIGPGRLGWRSIRLRRPGQLWESLEATDPKPDATVADLDGVMQTLAAADNTETCA